jgi:NAD+ synthase
MPAAEHEVTLEALRLDPEHAADEIAAAVREAVLRRLRRKGAIVAVSGGVDSAVAAALCVRALGPDRVVALAMPERESDPDALELSRTVADAIGIETLVEELTPVLDAAGCYRRRDEAIRSVIPDYEPGWRAKIVLPSLIGDDRMRVFNVVAESPSGERRTARPTAEAYREIVAATSFKQRTRKMFEYHHADRLHYAVAGTPNRLEYDQGFFVKNGDGAADLKPIAHLYKTQVYQLAAFLALPEEISARPPSTDTYALSQSQEEFYFGVPHGVLDLCLYAHNHGRPAASVAGAARLSEEDVERVFRDIDAKRRATAYLHTLPLLVEPVGEILVS